MYDLKGIPQRKMLQDAISGLEERRRFGRTR